MFKTIRKAVKLMTNKTSETIKAFEEFIINISENDKAKDLIGKILIGSGIGVGSGLLSIGLMFLKK